MKRYKESPPQILSVTRGKAITSTWQQLRKGLTIFLCTTGLALSQPAQSQSTTFALDDLSAFKDPGKTWKIVGGVTADLQTENKLSTSQGKGVLVNLPTSKEHGQDLYTTLEHGDADIELDYMIAKGSNSGIYLQGRYEIQLLDSWSTGRPTSADNGGIYERWDESKPEGQKGYQGYAPRQNVSKAPGLWQHLKISFQAPRFDKNGKKTEKAKFLLVALNGVPIHEDVEVTGPTRGAMDGNKEAAKGPLRIQGDHGAVAFRNITITTYDKPRPELKDLSYTVYEGKYESAPNYDSLAPEAEGTSVILTANLNKRPQQFLLRYQGTLHVEEPGEYTFNLNVPGGGGILMINNKEAVSQSRWNGTGKINLPEGDLPFELLYTKFVDWTQPALGLSVAGPGVREYLISDQGDIQGGDVVDPILVNAQQEPILRSFMDLPVGGRVTHGISVGSNQHVHYTYDLDHGMIVQVWRGDFLDTTPMWHDRGDGSSRPRGEVQYFGKPGFTIGQLASAEADWISDSTNQSFKEKGYQLDKNGKPVFHYQMYGTTVDDAISVTEDGKGFQRKITLEKPADNLYVRLAKGEKIEPMGKEGMYLVDDKAYYLDLAQAGTKPIVRGKSGNQELIMPIKDTVTYSILF